MDPVSAFYGFKYGYKGAAAVLEWLSAKSDLVEGSLQDLRELKKVTQALCEDNQRLIEVTEVQGKEITALRKGLGVILLLSIIINAGLAWALCEYFRH